MFGKQSLQKTIRYQQRVGHQTRYQKRSYLEIGSWRFEENIDGDLVVSNIETQQNVILFRRDPKIELAVEEETTLD